MQKEKLAKILFMIFLMVLSFSVLTRIIPESKFVQETIQHLEESQNTIMKFSGTTIATSLSLSALPNDFASPLASTVSDLNTYFIFIFAVLFVEKLVVIEGIKIALVWMIPAACILYIAAILTSKEMFKNFAKKLLILGNVICIVLFMIGFVWMLVKKSWQNLDMALVLGTMICSYVFWQLSAPLMRYGYAHVLLLNFLTVGWIIIKLGWKPMEMTVYFGILLYGGYKLFTVGEYISGNYLQKYYVWQQDYGVYDVEGIEIDGVMLYQGMYGDRTGYEYFPSVPTLEHVKLRGDGLEDGFYKELP